MTLIDCALDLQYLPNTKPQQYRLIDDFRVFTDTAGLIEIPAGTITDLNSTPRLIWNILPPTDYGEAAVPHDDGYKTGKINGKPTTRVILDRVHREIVTFRKAPRWRVLAYYAGLRACGWIQWNRYRKADV